MEGDTIAIPSRWCPPLPTQDRVRIVSAKLASFSDLTVPCHCACRSQIAASAGPSGSPATPALPLQPVSVLAHGGVPGIQLNARYSSAREDRAVLAWDLVDPIAAARACA